MITLLVTSKTMDLETAVPTSWEAGICPRFQEEAATLAKALSRLSLKRLREVMHISEALGKQTRERIQAFAPGPSPSPSSRPAALAFTGDVYQYLQAGDWGKAQVNYAAKHLRILSGLYGFLTPTEWIQAYRLEPGYSWSPSKKVPSLNQFWKEKVTEALATDLAALPRKQQVVVNLASNEFIQLIDWKQIQAPVITPVFKESKNGKLKTIALFSKQARGALARFQVTERLKTPEDLKRFSDLNYTYQADLSDEQSWIFVR